VSIKPRTIIGWRQIPAVPGRLNSRLPGARPKAAVIVARVLPAGKPDVPSTSDS
jgi:hypothetical protein